MTAFFQDAMTRSGGFNTVNVARSARRDARHLHRAHVHRRRQREHRRRHQADHVLPARLRHLAELRGEPDVTIGRRRIAECTQRQAMTVALLGVALVSVGTLGLIETTDGVDLQAALFEVTSAFATVGLSTGITPTLAGLGAADPGFVDVRRPGRNDRGRVGHRLEHQAPPVPIRGGASHRWLTSPATTTSSSSGWAASAARSPTRCSGSAMRCWASTTTRRSCRSGRNGSPTSRRRTPPTRRPCGSSACPTSGTPSSASAPTSRRACSPCSR